MRRGGSLGESAIENKMTSIFYGEGTNGADPNLITYDDQFLLGLNKFKGLYTQSVHAAAGGPNSSTGEVILSIPAFLHRHKKLFIYVGEGSIDKAILSQKSLLSVGEKISGRTLHRNAKTVLCNCKKMMAIVTRKGSPYRDGKFPSGTNWEDYILWCLIEMGKECDRAEAEKIDSVVVVATKSKNVVEGEKANGARGGDVGFLGEDDNEQNDTPSILANSSEDSDEADRYPDKTFFRCGVGFLAWALWGHIPIHNSACMQSDSFGDLKKNASVGRNVASRAQMRKLMIAECAASVDNRRGRKRRVTEDEVLPVPAPLVDSSSKLILAKTLQYLNADSLEKERQKNAQYMIRSVRDKLTARRRNEDSILRELDRFAKHKKKPGEALINKRDALEIEIASLEEKLDGLQSDECRRHSDMLKERSLEILATLSSSDAATTIARTDNNNQSSSADSADDDEDDVVDVTPAAAAAMHTIVNEGWCIECNTPSNHSCRKCKKCVCSLCCGQRELENVWWCNACFSTQTVVNQQLIRDGNYDSDEEDN